MMIVNPSWLPFLGVREAEAEIIEALELDPKLKWNVLAFEWFYVGWIFAIWPKKEKETSE